MKKYLFLLFSLFFIKYSSQKFIYSSSKSSEYRKGKYIGDKNENIKIIIDIDNKLFIENKSIFKISKIEHPFKSSPTFYIIYFKDKNELNKVQFESKSKSKTTMVIERGYYGNYSMYNNLVTIH